MPDKDQQDGASAPGAKSETIVSTEVLDSSKQELDEFGFSVNKQETDKDWQANKRKLTAESHPPASFEDEAETTHAEEFVTGIDEERKAEVKRPAPAKSTPAKSTLPKATPSKKSSPKVEPAPKKPVATKPQKRTGSVAASGSVSAKAREPIAAKPANVHAPAKPAPAVSQPETTPAAKPEPVSTQTVQPANMESKLSEMKDETSREVPAQIEPKESTEEYEDITAEVKEELEPLDSETAYEMPVGYSSDFVELHKVDTEKFGHVNIDIPEPKVPASIYKVKLLIAYTAEEIEQITKIQEVDEIEWATTRLVVDPRRIEERLHSLVTTH